MISPYVNISEGCNNQWRIKNSLGPWYRVLTVDALGRFSFISSLDLLILYKGCLVPGVHIPICTEI